MPSIAFIRDLLIRFNQHFEKTIDGEAGGFKKLLYLFDVVLSFIIHGSSLTDYFEYEFYKKRNLERKEFVTWRKAQRYFKILNRRLHR